MDTEGYEYGGDEYEYGGYGDWYEDIKDKKEEYILNMLFGIGEFNIVNYLPTPNNDPIATLKRKYRKERLDLKRGYSFKSRKQFLQKNIIVIKKHKIIHHGKSIFAKKRKRGPGGVFLVNT